MSFFKKFKKLIIWISSIVVATITVITGCCCGFIGVKPDKLKPKEPESELVKIEPKEESKESEVVPEEPKKESEVVPEEPKEEPKEESEVVEEDQEVIDSVLDIVSDFLGNKEKVKDINIKQREIKTEDVTLKKSISNASSLHSESLSILPLSVKDNNKQKVLDKRELIQILSDKSNQEKYKFNVHNGYRTFVLSFNTNVLITPGGNWNLVDNYYLAATLPKYNISVVSVAMDEIIGEIHEVNS